MSSSNSPISSWRDSKSLKNYLHKKGKLLVWTKIYVAPLGFEQEAPYFSGIVEFEDKLRLPVQIVDCTEDQLKPNLKVQTVIRRGKKVSESEVIEYTVKVKPI